MTPTTTEISLPAAAVRLRKNWRQTFDLVLSGKLEGRQAENKRWTVLVASLERFERDRDTQLAQMARSA